MNTDTLIAVICGLVTIEATVVGGVWILSSRIGDLQSSISSLEAHRDAHATALGQTTDRVTQAEARVTMLGERVAIVEDRTRDR